MYSKVTTGNLNVIEVLVFILRIFSKEVMGIEYACKEKWVVYYRSYFKKSSSEEVHYALKT